jgi:hypothetical protein
MQVIGCILYLHPQNEHEALIPAGMCKSKTVSGQPASIPCSLQIAFKILDKNNMI